ncbi:hypothetical protein MKX03_024681 [Papaver bracteatum]|nr:hypothetical protein MKX03_024681 [Papaver bracteatum]
MGDYSSKKKGSFDLVHYIKIGDFVCGKLSSSSSSEVETLKKEKKIDPYADFIASQKALLKTLQQGETAIQIMIGVAAVSMASVVVLRALGF